MCGIAGLLKTNSPVDQHELTQLTDVLEHRGPDGVGYYIFQNIGLVHRRLSIIDLETGKQPISNEDQTIWITFNGEIYNYRELRQELINRGHSFRTHSDTETIVHSYEEWGNECVQHLRGMFAFAILDQNKRELFLARDHFGIKPLVYLHTPDVFAFASEIQALKKIEGVDWSMDIAALDQYLQFQYIPAPSTIYKHVRKLPPAHYMRVGFDGTIKEINRYWKLEFKPDYEKTEAQWLEELDAIMRDSVKAHLVSDVPFGAFLSGGIDSSTVVGYMAQLMNRPVKTFSIGFEEKEFDETHCARLVADKWKTEHYEEIVKPDALGILPQLVKHYGEPFADSSAISTYYVSKLAREHVTMVLTGDAGDEMFAGYESYTTRWNRHFSPIPEHLHPVKKVAYRLLSHLNSNRYPLRTSVITDWVRYVQSFDDQSRKQLWKSDLRDTIQEANRDVHEKFFKESHSFSHFHKAQYTDFNTYLPGAVLTKVDIASMMHSLETRTPLLDIKVVEFAATIPEKFNISKNGSGKWVGKQLLKKLQEKQYSHDFLYRKKMGFATPISRWLHVDERKNQDFSERLLESKDLNNLFDRTEVQAIIKSSNAGRIWLLMFLEEWLRNERK